MRFDVVFYAFIGGIAANEAFHAIGAPGYKKGYFALFAIFALYLSVSNLRRVAP